MFHLSGNRFLASTAVLLLILGISSFASAAVYWDGATGDWITDANWDTDTVPTSSDDAYINNGGTALIDGSDTAAARRFYLGNASTESGTIDISGGSLTTSGDHSRVGNSGTGTVTQTNGSVNIGNYAFYLGYNATGNGTYTISDGSFTARYLRVGVSGTGLFNHSGGTVETTTEDMIVGWRSGGVGTYNLSGGGDLQPLELNVGGRHGESSATPATGTFNQTGGTNTVATSLYIGSEGGTGTYNLTSGTLTVGGDIREGSSNHSSAGSSTFNVEGSSYTLTVTGGDIAVDNFSVGYAGGSNGQFTLDSSGPRITTAYQNIGYYGTGTFTQTGGTNSVTAGGAGAIYIGREASGVGTYNLSGDGQLTAHYLRVGESGDGTFHQTGGTVTVDTQDLIVGRFAGATGVYNLSGDGVIDARTISVGGRNSGDSTTSGSGGTGTFNQTGGTNDIVLGLYIGSRGGTGTYNLTSGTLTVGGNIAEGAPAPQSDSSSTFNIEGPTSGYTLTVTGGSISVDNFGVGYAAGSNGQFTLSSSGPAISAENEYVGYQGTGSVTQTGGTNTIANDLSLGTGGGSGTYRLTGGTLSVGGDITGGGYTANNESSRFYIDAEEADYTLSVGGNISVNRFRVGDASGSTGEFTLDGSGPNVTSEWQSIGYDGTGTFTQTGGTNSVTTADGAIYIGRRASGVGTYNLSGDGQLTARYLRVGENGDGTFHQTGGTVTVNAVDLIVGRFTGATGEYNLSGDGVINARTMSVGGRDTGDANNSVQGGTGTFTQTGGTNDIALGLHLGSRGGNGTYIISDGLLDVDGSLVVGNTGTENNSSGVPQDKTGTGLFKIIGDDALIEVDGYSQNSLSTLELDINGISPINVDGTISLDGFLDVEFIVDASPGAQHTLFVNDGTDLVDGIFSGMPEGYMFTPSGSIYTVSISYLANVDAGTVGNDVVLTVTPEPSTLVLLIGLATLLLVRLRPLARRAKD